MSRKAKDAARKTRLTERRRDVERRLSSLRDALDDEVGYAPRGRKVTLLLLAASAGLALGLRGKARKEGRLPGNRVNEDPLGDL